MATIKPFRGIRPPKEFVERVESRPYDVLESDEARAEAGDNEMSLYHIIKPEIDFPEGTSEYDPRVYEKAAENFQKFQDKGWLVQDDKENYYIYAQTMNGKTQYGLVIGAYVDDYMNGIIKKLYESYATEKITEKRFEMMSAEYEQEQATLEEAVAKEQTELDAFEADTVRVDQFMALARKYTDFSELTTPMINEFIEKIIVHAPEKVDGDRVQQVDIYLSFIGQFELPAPELSPEEEKKQEQLKRHRIKSRERYQQIKAGEHTVGQPYKCTCKCCGKEFDAKRSNAMYCSPSCQQKYYRQQAAKERSRECVCENCGKTFTTTRSDVKYCCEDCRYQAQIKRQGAKKAAKRAAEKGQTVPLPTERNEEISAAQDAAEEKSA